jgi:hypothetical protein
MTYCRSLYFLLGTGNATPDLPTVMMERLYTSPTYGMCAYPHLQHNVAFPYDYT